MSKEKKTISTILVMGLLVAAVFAFEIEVLPRQANAAATTTAQEWSPTRPYPVQEVYYPGTESLGENEMRIIACGSGMPMPRLKQAAACFLIELGNGDKLIFDLGTGSFTTLYALGIPLDYMTKIFLTHQHADHMGDVPTLWIYGMQNGRSKPLEIWGPGGGGMPETEEEGAKLMEAWGTWLGSFGDKLVDGGNPFGAAVTIQPDGSTVPGGGSNPATGYSLIEADSLEAAIEGARGCPTFASGGSVEVAEALEV